MSRCDFDVDDETGAIVRLCDHPGWFCAKCNESGTFTVTHILCDHLDGRIVFGKPPRVCAMPVCPLHVHHDKAKGDLCHRHAPKPAA